MGGESVTTLPPWPPKTGKEEERPIAHASKSLTKTQRQYCVTRKELLAVVYFVQYFRHYLLGRDFIRTDHSALRWVMSFKDPRDQMARWLEVLCQYRFKIVQRSGKKHSNADSLSRVPCDPTECMCYDGKTVLCDLPCGGCDVCQRKHEQWSSFQEMDDVVPLMARRVNIRNQVHPVHSRFGYRLTCKILLFIGLCLSLSAVWFKACTGCFRGKKHQVRNKPGGESRWQRLNRAKTTQAARSNERMTGERDQTKEEGNSDQCKDSSGTGAQLPVLDDAWLSQYTRTDLRKLQLNDPDLAHLHTWLELEDGKPTRDQVAVETPTVRNLWLQWDQLVLDNGV